MDKPDFVMAVIDEELQFPENALEGLRNFKSHFKMEGPGTFQERMAARIDGMRTLMMIMADDYHIPAVTVRMSNIVPNGDSSSSYYNSAENLIMMIGKLSIITLLHEFAHALQWTSADEVITATREPNPEPWARVYSLTLFRKMYPVAFERLGVSTGSTSEGFCLVSPSEHPEEEVTAPGTVLTDEGDEGL